MLSHLRIIGTSMVWFNNEESNVVNRGNVNALNVDARASHKKHQVHMMTAGFTGNVATP